MVSSHDSSSWLDFVHERWGDYLNVKDLCVVWGTNVENELYDHFSFKSGDFTCYFGTSDQGAWEVFKPRQISNNHLLTGDRLVAHAILSARPGDQVRFSGYLANYSNDKGFRRGTSTTRLDQGNGACETVYVEEFSFIDRPNMLWHQAWKTAWFGLAICLAGWTWLFLHDLFSTSLPDPGAMYHQACMYAARGKYKKALALYDEVLRMDPDMGEAYTDRAMVHEALGDFYKASQDRDRAARYAKTPDNILEPDV